MVKSGNTPSWEGYGEIVSFSYLADRNGTTSVMSNLAISAQVTTVYDL